MKTALLTFPILFLLIKGAHCGWHNFLCPTLSNSTIYFPCDLDCLHQHGASYGTCGSIKTEDYNCYCGPMTDQVHPESLMCAEDNPNYHLICNIDCQCSHAALGGTCNFEKKVCGCYGRDTANELCPFIDVQGFALFVAEMAGTEGYVGAYVEPFLPPGYVRPTKPINVGGTQNVIGKPEVKA